MDWSKPRISHDYTAVFTGNNFESLRILLYGWRRNLSILAITTGEPLWIPNVLKRMTSIEKYIRESIKERKANLGEYKGLWYEVNNEAIALTMSFYNKKINNKNRLIRYYNKYFNTAKFEAYIKKETAFHVFNLLKAMHVLRLLPLENNEILMTRNPLNEFVMGYVEGKYGQGHKVRWVSPMPGSAFLTIYYKWLFKELIRRGIVFNKKKKTYKISKEAVWGFHLPH